MLVKLFLVSIIIITCLIILYELNDTTNTSNNKTEEVIDSPADVKKPSLKKSKPIQNNSCKKVHFNLDKNMIKLISPKTKAKNIEIKYNEYKSSNNNSIIKDKVEFDNQIPGTNILENSHFFESTDHSLKDPQGEFVKKLNYQKDDDLFTNQKGYWESQNLDNYINRSYSNDQVDKFNKIRESNITGQNIATVYDSLSGVKDRDFANTFSESLLRHDDNSIMKNMDDSLYGYSSDCVQAKIEN
jgi:hypothetical protein